MANNKTEPRRYWLGGKRKAEQDRFFKQALDGSQWQAGDSEDWDACWFTGMPEASQFRKAGPDRKINHIPGNNALTVKSRLHNTVAAMRERTREQFGPEHESLTRLGFLPKVYSLPHDYHALQQDALEDPSKRWILKPKNAARGKGIRVVRDVADVPMEESWMVQEYIQAAHTMRQRKYVLRLYVLVASVEPLRVYLYEQGFAKLASAPYDVNDFANPFSQLTNPDINALNTEVEVPVEFVDLTRYRQWLREEGHDDELLFERIRDLVTLTMIAAVEPMRRRTAEYGADPQGCYELLGIDCLIDDELNPWILECNLSPSLGICAGAETGGLVEEQIKGKLVADMASLVGLNLSAVVPPVSDPAERIRTEAENEYARAGGFQRLYPADNVERYLPFFSLPRLADIVLADAVIAGSDKATLERPQLQCRYATEIIADDQLAVYEEYSGRLSTLNETASFIWLMAMDGADPDTIAEKLTLSAAAVNGEVPDPWAIRKDVWDCLADWAHAGLVIQRANDGSRDGERSIRTSAPVPVRKPVLNKVPFQASLSCGAQRLHFYTVDQPVTARLEPMLSSLAGRPRSTTSPRIEVARDNPGYALIFDGEVVASRLRLASVGPALSAWLARRAATSEEMIMDAALVQIRNAGSAIFASAQPELDDSFALHFAKRFGRDFARGLRLNARQPGPARALGLPGQSGGFLIPATRECLVGTHEIESVFFPCLEEVPPVSKIRPLSVRDALAALSPVCFMADGAPLDAAALLALLDWLTGRDLYSIEISDFEAASEALVQLNPNRAARYEHLSQEATSIA